MKRVHCLIWTLLALSVCSACRRHGLYDPVYSEAQIKQLLQNHGSELSEVALAWTGEYNQLRIQYSSGDKGAISVLSDMGPKSWEQAQCTATARVGADGQIIISNSNDGTSQSACGLGIAEADSLLKLFNSLKIDTVSSPTVDPSWKHRYVEITFQGGGHGPREWPYGLIYIPSNESMNLLSSANGDPGPGFSKLDQLGGRWLYFESSGH